MPKTLDTFPIYNNKNLKRILKTLKLVLKTAKRTDMHTSLKTNMIKQRHKKVHLTSVSLQPLSTIQLVTICNSGFKQMLAHRDVNDTLWLETKTSVFGSEAEMFKTETETFFNTLHIRLVGQFTYLPVLLTTVMFCSTVYSQSFF